MIINIVYFFCIIFFCSVRVLTYMHFLQQDNYNPFRFLLWVIKNKAFDIKASLLILCCYIIFLNHESYSRIVISILVIIISLLEYNVSKKAKKPLIITDRAKRIIYLAILIVIFQSYFFTQLPVIFSIISIYFVPICIVISYFLLLPIDTFINNSFRDEAIEKMKELKPFVISIAGSYGKTSVKHILGHILNTLDCALFTSGSVNSEMGIVRIIRNQLNSSHKFFIVEMGAYGIGSIAKLCKLTKPDLSIVTSIDVVHFERFKLIKNIAIAKLEAAEIVVKNNGKVFLLEKILSILPVKIFYQKHKKNVIVCDELVKLLNYEEGSTGLNIVFEFNKIKYTCNTPVHGLQNVNNILMSFVVAEQLGFDPLDILVSLQTLSQIKHRLEVQFQKIGIFIDNAYSSNPESIKSSLQLLNKLRVGAGRRIMITPGMIELGDRHKEEHIKFAELAIEHTDIVIVVSHNRIKSFVDYYKSHKKNEQMIIMVTSFVDANNWLHKNIKKEDVILIENDLPDLYEKQKLL